MAKNKRQLLEQPLMIVLISFLAILLMLSLQESKRKAALDSKNLEQNRQNIALLEKSVADKEAFSNKRKATYIKKKF